MIARKYLVIKDKKRRNNYLDLYKKKVNLKIKLFTSPFFQKIRIKKKIQKMERKDSRIRNYCLLTGSA